MKILFLCTAHNSLSQRLYLALCQQHSITIEYAISEGTMIEAVSLAQPHLIICPFLTSRVPAEIYSNFLTLIVHPGPPGDAGPSSLDWVLMGDDGLIVDENQLLETNAWSRAGRSHWGVTVLQAVEEFDTGPVWAFEQFKININDPEVTKSSIYRGPVTDAVVTATFAALDRITMLAGRTLTAMPVPEPITSSKLLPRAKSASERSSLLSTDQLRVQKTISPKLVPDDSYRSLSITTQQPFQGGPTHRRPLLKAAQRSFNIRNDSAHNISRKIRSADSQPGCLTQIFGGFDLYIYGGIIEDRQHLLWQSATRNQAKDESSSAPEPGIILAQRDGAVCIATSDGKGIWVSHVRRVKRKEDAFLWPKVPATLGLHELGLLGDEFKPNTYCKPLDWSKASHSTYQSVWVDFDSYNDASHVAYVYFEFYNGAMGTAQCTQLLRVLEAALAAHTDEKPLAAVVLMGGKSYFSNGIALNVIEANGDPSGESWRNINRINDVVHMLLEVLPGRGITTIAAVRGNCAAGGVAMAAACDFVVAGSGIVLNPAYGALALYGSEYHTLTYPARCGVQVAKQISSKMCPVSPFEARKFGLVDYVLPGSGHELDAMIRSHIGATICAPGFRSRQVQWKAHADLSSDGLAAARTRELGEMAQNFWGRGSERYHISRRDFVRKVKPMRTPLQFAEHRQNRGLVRKSNGTSRNDDTVLTGRSPKAVETSSLATQDCRCSRLCANSAETVSVRTTVLKHHEDKETLCGAQLIFPCYYCDDS